MVIQWYGQSCFKIQSGDLTLIFDPFSKEIGLTPPRGKADVVFVSHNHSDHNNYQSFEEGYFLIASPGEYDIKNIFVSGIPSYHDNEKGKMAGLNTIYNIDLDEVKICHLGDLGQKELTSEQIDAIGEIDILIAPVGGKYSLGKEKYSTLDYESAEKIINQIEPRIVIPMHYKIPNLKLNLDGIEEFLKEMGVSKENPIEKLTLKKKDLPEEMKIIVMKI